MSVGMGVLVGVFVAIGGGVSVLVGVNVAVERSVGVFVAAGVGSSESGQIRAVPSPLPVRILVPSGENATDAPPPVCAENLRIVSPVSASHNVAASYLLPIRTFVPSGENATEYTQSNASLPGNWRISSPVSVFHNFAVPS